jgi:hypothetical protein
MFINKLFKKNFVKIFETVQFGEKRYRNLRTKSFEKHYKQNFRKMF